MSLHKPFGVTFEVSLLHFTISAADFSLTTLETVQVNLMSPSSGRISYCSLEPFRLSFLTVQWYATFFSAIVLQSRTTAQELFEGCQVVLTVRTGAVVMGTNGAVKREIGRHYGQWEWTWTFQRNSVALWANEYLTKHFNYVVGHHQRQKYCRS